MAQDRFFEQLDRELNEIGADYQIPGDGTRFAVWVGRAIFREDPQELIEERILFDGYGTGVEFCVIRVGDNPESGAELVICDFTYDRETQVNCDELFAQWTQALASDTRLTAPGQEFAEALREDPATPIIQYVASVRTGLTCSSGKVLDADQLEILYARNLDPNSVDPPESLEIPAATMDDGIHLPVGGAGGASSVQVHIMPLPLSLIHNWVSNHEYGLFAENLRDRLAGKSDRGARELDEAIRTTVETAPERMLIQNNGLTITCRALEKHADGRGILSYPQIVNGCQTSWAIHEAVSAALLKGQPAPHGFALAKIVETVEPAIAQEITRTSNKQNAILLRDEAGRDPHQVEIARALSDFATNIRVHWDHRRGAMANILRKPEAHEYRVMGTKIYRSLQNDLGGQVMLAMAGAVPEAKNKLADLFNPASPLPRWAFAYHLPAEERFRDLKVNSYLQSGGAGALDTYVADLMFGFAVYRYAIAVFREGYAATLAALTKHAKQQQADPALSIGKKTEHDFVRYWAFDVVRLTHRVVEAWVERGKDREGVRRALVGDLRLTRYIDALFQGKSVRHNWFRADDNPARPHVLNPDTQPDELFLPRWFVELERIGARVIVPLKNPSTTARDLVLSRRQTGTELLGAVESEIADSALASRFPLPQE